MFNRIKSVHFTIIQKLIIFILILILLIIIRYMAVRRIESEVVFSQDSVLIKYNVTNESFKNGFIPTNDQIAQIKEEFKYVTQFKLLIRDVIALQHVDFAAVPVDFIETGVPYNNHFLQANIVQKIRLVDGRVWNKNSKEPEVIIDEATARLIYGTTKVVGKTLPTIQGDLEIIGVVTDTNERELTIERMKNVGQKIDESMYSGNAYISLGYLSTLSVETFGDSIIVRDPNFEVNELKQRLKEILNVPLDDKYIVQDRQDIINHVYQRRSLFFQVLFPLSITLTIFGILNLINYYIVSKRIYKFKWSYING